MCDITKDLQLDSALVKLESLHKKEMALRQYLREKAKQKAFCEWVRAYIRSLNDKHKESTDLRFVTLQNQSASPVNTDQSNFDFTLKVISFRSGLKSTARTANSDLAQFHPMHDLERLNRKFLMKQYFIKWE